MPGNRQRDNSQRDNKDRDRRRGRPQEEEREQLDERVVHIARTAKVVKGGRRFSFRAVVVVGDNHGQVGYGVGKAREVPDAVRKGSERAQDDAPLPDDRHHHPARGDRRLQRGAVLIRPASPGTGVIAGGGVRAVWKQPGFTIS